MIQRVMNFRARKEEMKTRPLWGSYAARRFFSIEKAGSIPARWRAVAFFLSTPQVGPLLLSGVGGKSVPLLVWGRSPL